jgi:ArsR family transcriptional regulator
MEYLNYALCFKALGDETRIEIIDMLKFGKMCACKILEKFEITQPTLSYHMKILTDSGLVFVEKEGIWNYYSLNIELLNNLTKFLNKKN